MENKNINEIKDKLINIYERKLYPLSKTGFNNDGDYIEYKNIQFISFVKYFTRLLAYGSKTAEDYIAKGCSQIVMIIETMLNDDVKHIEKCNSIEEVIDNLLSLSGDFDVYWLSKPTFDYTLNQIYLNKKLDNKHWGW